jgi:putative acetyltransferase
VTEPEITFRPGRPEDGAALLEVHRRAIELLAVRDYTPEVARSWAHGLTAEGYARSMRDGEVFEIAVFGDRAVAFCGIKADEVCGLYVDPDCMRQGIASTLLDRALNRIAHAGHTGAKVTASLTAVPLYQKHGFRIVRESLRRTRGGLEMAVVDMEL